MPTDPSVILGIKSVDMPNPLDSAAKALTMKNLMTEGQMNSLKLNQAQRDAADQQTVRDAYKNNTVIAPDGTPVTNRQGVLSDLGKANPLLAQKQALDYRQMDIDRLNQTHQLAKGILFSINDQQSQDEAMQKARELGLPPLEKVLPQQYDPSAVRKAQMSSLSAEEQLAQMNKQQELAMEKQKNEVEIAKLGMEQAHFNYTKKFDANQQVQASLEGSRQSDDAKQALKDVQAANKVNGLLDQARDKNGNLDYNKLDNQQIRLLYGEVGKIAQGGAPTEGGLRDMTPETAKAMMANYQSLATNKPVPAEMGQFIKKIKAYTDELADQGKTLIRNRENRIVDQRRDDLGENNYQNFKAGIAKAWGDGSNSVAKAKPQTAPRGGKAIMSFDEWKSQQAGNSSGKGSGG